MKELAQLIRKGLARQEVKEEPLTWGADEFGGMVEANVVGLALIGKIGIDSALRLFEKSLEESCGAEGSYNTEEILRELGLSDIDQTEKLVALHHEKSAEKIAKMLESGKLVL